MNPPVEAFASSFCNGCTVMRLPVLDCAVTSSANNLPASISAPLEDVLSRREVLPLTDKRLPLEDSANTLPASTAALICPPLEASNRNRSPFKTPAAARCEPPCDSRPETDGNLTITFFDLARTPPRQSPLTKSVLCSALMMMCWCRLSSASTLTDNASACSTTTSKPPPADTVLTVPVMFRVCV